VVLDSQTTPKTVVEDQVTEVVFSVRVLDPDDDIDSVTIDLSGIGLSEQDMYDDGQVATSGDAVAGDNIFSAKADVNAGYGLYELIVTATDLAAHLSEGAVTLEVASPGVRVVDNPEATVVGPWGTLTTPATYGNNLLYILKGGGSNTVRWTPDLALSGTYKVSAWWHANSNRVTDAEFTIVYNGGTDVVDENQEINGGQWVRLGFYPFAAGTSGYVELSDDSDDPADQYVIADAVKFELVDLSEVIIDNPEATTVGTWPTITSPQGYGGKIQYHLAGGGSNTVTWTAPPVLDGEYKVYAWWHANPNRVTDAEYTINHFGGPSVVDVNQEINGGQWNQLGTGTYSFVSGTAGSVVLSDASDDPADQYVIADAVRFERVP
jgi:hyaluronate lyase